MKFDERTPLHEAEPYETASLDRIRYNEGSTTRLSMEGGPNEEAENFRCNGFFVVTNFVVTREF